jgi:hypothetical protein
MLLSFVYRRYQSRAAGSLLISVMDMFLTFITSSSLFSLFDRALFFCLAAALAGAPAGLGFDLDFADMVATLNGQNKPKVVMGFRQEQAGLN